MSWAKLDDRANEHQKQLLAGPEACWLWACGLMYANRQEARDGFIPSLVLPMLYPFKSPKRLAERLVEVGLWDATDNGYVVHNFTKWNKTQEQVQAERDATRNRVRDYRARNATGNAVTPPDVTDPCNARVPDPLHSTPLPVQERSERGESAAGAAGPKKPRRVSRVPEAWEPKPEHVNLAMQLGADLTAELAKFRDHEFRNPKSDFDACFRTWLRRSIELRRQAIGQRLTEGRAADALEKQVARANALRVLERKALP